MYAAPSGSHGVVRQRQAASAHYGVLELCAGNASWVCPSIVPVCLCMLMEGLGLMCMQEGSRSRRDRFARFLQPGNTLHNMLSGVWVSAGDMGGDDHLHPVLRDEPWHR